MIKGLVLIIILYPIFLVPTRYFVNRYLKDD